jgi:uncharacterized membrane protein
MRTTITIPEDIIKELQHYAHTKKTTAAVIIAIQEWVRWKKIAELKKLRGKLNIADNLEHVRKQELKKLRNLDE